MVATMLCPHRRLLYTFLIYLPHVIYPICYSTPFLHVSARSCSFNVDVRLIGDVVLFPLLRLLLARVGTTLHVGVTLDVRLGENLVAASHGAFGTDVSRTRGLLNVHDNGRVRVVVVAQGASECQLWTQKVKCKLT